MKTRTSECPNQSSNPIAELVRLVGILCYRLARIEAHLSAIRGGGQP